MDRHEFTHQQALDLLMRKLRERNEMLARNVQSAIDAGKDIEEEEPSSDRRKKPRIYRKTVRVSDEEALQLAVDALQAYFVDLPLFIDEAFINFTKAAVGIPTQGDKSSKQDEDGRDPLTLERLDEEKQLAIELHTETQVTRDGDEIIDLERPSKLLIEEQMAHIKEIRALIAFSEG